MTLDPGSPVPKHLQLRDILLDLIEGELAPDQAIASERELSERYGVARMTARRAIETLVAEGRLFTVPGRGTFVAPPKFDLQLRLTSYHEEMERRGMVPASKVLAFDREQASAHVARELGIGASQPVVHYRRLRFADGVPMALERTYLIDARVPGLADEPPPASIYDTLGRRFGLAPDWGEDTIEAGEADAEVADLLQVRQCSPVLYIERHAYSGQTLVEYSVASYRADRYKLWVPLARPGPRITNPRR